MVRDTAKSIRQSESQVESFVAARAEGQFRRLRVALVGAR